MKILRSISLLVLGIFFILSGFAKAVDPSGGASQIADYMYAFHIEFLVGLAHFFAIGLAATEFVVGMHLLLRFRIKVVAWPALALMLFFTPLTLVILVFNPVSDCGCFGEAFKLTHWETFIKNLVLLPMSYIVFKARHELDSPLKGFMGWAQSAFQVAFILSVSFVAFYDAPIFDFRPFKVGVNIPQAMSIPPGAEQPEYDTRFIMEKDGVQQEFGVVDYPYTDSTWVFVSSKTITLKEGYQPPITDFHVTDILGVEANGLLTDAEKPVFVVLSPRLSEMDTTNINKLIRLSYLARDNGYNFYCLTNSTNEEIAKFDYNWGAQLKYLITDYRVIRTVSRANPGLMLLDKGTIIGKWNFNRIGSIAPFQHPVSAALAMERERSNRIMLFACVMLLVAGTSIFYRYKS